MKVTFKTFQSGIGDCIFLLLKQGEKQFSIMVDCGKRTDAIASYIHNDLHNKIDLLVATHIDNDHISGLATILSEMPELQIGKILFNSYHRENTVQPQPLNERQLAILAELKRRCPSIADVTEGKVNAKEAISLSECILKNEAWRTAWAQKPVVKGDTIDLGDFGKITILSPRKEDLDLLENQFKKEFWSKFYEKYNVRYDSEEVIYEILLRLWETALVESKTDKIGYIKATKETFEKAADAPVQPVSLPNQCSIAFVYEYEGHRFLLLGDADPVIVTFSIKELYTAPYPLMMNLIKVSHHGSAHSTTKELITIADSEHYYFTGGNREERPSLETLARIITSPLHNQERRILHFTRMNQVLKDLSAMPELNNYPCELDSDNHSYEIEIQDIQ